MQQPGGGESPGTVQPRDKEPPPPPLHPPTGAFSPSSLRGVWTFLPPASGQTWNVLRGPQSDSGLEGTHRSSAAAEQTSPPGISSSVGGDPLLSPRSGGTWDARMLPHQGMREPAWGGHGVPQRSVASRPTVPQTAPPPVFGVLEAHHGPSAGAEAQTSRVVPVKFRVCAGSLLASWSPIQDSPAFSLSLPTSRLAPRLVTWLLAYHGTALRKCGL